MQFALTLCPFPASVAEHQDVLLAAPEMHPLSATGPGPSFGQELLAALLHGGSARNGAAKAVAAARILSHLLAGCAQAKAQATAAQVPPTGQQPQQPQPQQNGSGSPAPVPLLAACCAQALAALAAGPVSTPAAAALQGLLVVWCHACAPAAAMLASQAETLRQLADLTATRCVCGR